MVSAMDPCGAALRAYYEGDRSATMVMRRDDGLEVPLPEAVFFRELADFSDIDLAALQACRGRVLDVGAGAGRHSLALRERGVTVTAIDVSADAVHVMRARGLDDVRQADVFVFEGGPFDTVLLLGNGAGILAGDEGLRRFLEHAAHLLAPGGQVLVESLDATATDDPGHLAYHDRNRRAGLPPGMTRLQMEFGGITGPWFWWPHFAPEDLQAEACRAGWEVEILMRDEIGQYLAGLTHAEAVT